MSEKLTCSNDTLPDQSLLATAKDLQVGHFRTRAAASPPTCAATSAARLCARHAFVIEAAILLSNEAMARRIQRIRRQ